MHLKAVAELVAGVTGDLEMIAAACLYDVVEDTSVTRGREGIRRRGGAAGRRAHRRQPARSRHPQSDRRAHLVAASPRAKTIKRADLTDNAGDTCRHDATFGRVYLAEMEALLGVLGEGDAARMAKARDTHTHWRAQLESPRRELGDKVRS